MLWAGKISCIRNRASEIVNLESIYGGYIVFLRKKCEEQGELPKESIDTLGKKLNHTSLYGIIDMPKYARAFISEINCI